MSSLQLMNNMSKEGEEKNFHDLMSHSSSYGNVGSRYLKETTSSCHDLCKFGRKHDSKNDEKHLTFKKFIANRVALEGAHRLVKDPTVADRKKKLVIKMMTSDTDKVAKQNIQSKKDVKYDVMTPSSKHESDMFSSKFILTEDSNQHNGSLAKEIGLSDKVFSKTLSPIHKSLESVMEIQANANDDEKDQEKISAIVEAEKNTNIGLMSLLVEDKNIRISQQMINSEPIDEEINHLKISKCRMDEKLVNKSKASSLVTKSNSAKSTILKQKNFSSSAEVDSRWDKSFFKEKIVSNLKESIVPKRLEVNKQKNIVSNRHSGSLKLHSSNQNSFLSSRKANVSAELPSSVNARSPLNSSKWLNGPRNLHRNSNNERPEVVEMKSWKSRKAVIASTAPVLSTMRLKSRNSKYVKHVTLEKSGNYKDGYGHIHDKILEVTKPKLEGDGYASKSATCQKSEVTLNKTIQKKHRGGFSKEEEKRRPRRTPAVPAADSSSSPYKLKFKRGKVIELREAENIVPKRLRFSRRRLLAENPSGDVVKRISRRNKDVGESIGSNSETHDIMLKKANLESKGVKLKHQNALVKKEMQSLFNHVIEETASKLVETRKSKVKALVGAFESVILLQGAKLPSMV